MMKALRIGVVCLAFIGVTSLAVFAESVRVHGTVQSVGPGRTLVLKADDGRTLSVDFSLDDIDVRLLTAGEKVTVTGATGREPNVFMARDVVQDRAVHTQRLHGTIASLGPGRRLVLRTDDGRTVNVDFSRDHIDSRVLTVGEKLTVAGATGPESDVFTALNVIQDEAVTMQKVYGTIVSVGPGRTLVLRTDDGRTLTVDFSRDTSIDVRQLTRGERVTAAGVTGREPNVFTARNVVLENAAASPSTRHTK